MKNKALYMMWPLFLLCVVAMQSCSGDGYEGGSDNKQKRALSMNLSLDGFNEVASRAASDFSNGAKVYIDFNGTTGTAEYDGSQWTIDCPDNLQETSSGTCSVVYVENPSSQGSSSVSLSSSSIVYEATGTFKNTVDEMSVTATLSPSTSRVHFRGKSGTSITVKGLKCNKQFSISNFTFSTSNDDITLSVKSDGYTDYVYCLFSASTNDLAIVNDGSTYTRRFASNVLQAGHSGYIDIPTADSFSGWETDRKTNVDINGSDYDGSDSDWNQKDPDPENNLNAPVNGYDNDENWNATVHNGHEYVDLGLSVKWATMNVGALKPEGYGHYFAWGEIYSKTEYNWDTYKDNPSHDGKTFTKYATDKQTVLDPDDDVAHVKWGGNWRMPTKAEQDELYEKCTWTWTAQNGVKGYVVTGPNRNSIFLPPAGYRDYSSLYDAGSCGVYLSSSLYENYSSNAYELCFISNDVYGEGSSRYYGRSVRPVCR